MYSKLFLMLLVYNWSIQLSINAIAGFTKLQVCLSFNISWDAVFSMSKKFESSDKPCWETGTVIVSR